MQVVTEGSLPEPLPPYPVDPESAKKDPETGELISPLEDQNAVRAKERASFKDVVDWEALYVTDRSLTFRVLFADPLKISADESTTDTLFISMNLAEF